MNLSAEIVLANTHDLCFHMHMILWNRLDCRVSIGHRQGYKVNYRSVVTFLCTPAGQ